MILFWWGYSFSYYKCNIFCSLNFKQANSIYKALPSKHGNILLCFLHIRMSQMFWMYLRSVPASRSCCIGALANGGIPSDMYFTNWLQLVDEYCKSNWPLNKYALVFYESKYAITPKPLTQWNNTIFIPFEFRIKNNHSFTVDIRY
jgi:hypothetical protein